VNKRKGQMILMMQNANLRSLASLPGLCIAIALLAVTPAHAGTDCDPGVLGVIEGRTVLPKNCTYHQTIRITASNTTLDCQGSTFVGSGQEKIGLMIDSEGKPLSVIVVKNCGFNGFASSGVRVTWSAQDVKKGTDHEAIYRRSPTRIVLDNISVKDNGGVGIYLDDYVSDVTIRNSEITGSGGVGIYLEHSSRKITLVDNNITGNGFRDGGKAPREGVAVDSSADNRIERNVFKGNAAGGIFLYKNCGEHFSTGTQVIRWQHSDNNLIKDNVFTNEAVGVWLASRQQRDLSRWDCGDAPIGGKGRYADFADNNQVENNTFCKTAVAVTDDGKNNVVRGSTNQCTPPSRHKNQLGPLPNHPRDI
jgi:parallel beta-helix repeat protein